MTALLVIAFLGGVFVGIFANEARWLRELDAAMRERPHHPEEPK